MNSVRERRNKMTFFFIVNSVGPVLLTYMAAQHVGSLHDSRSASHTNIYLIYHHHIIIIIYIIIIIIKNNFYNNNNNNIILPMSYYSTNYAEERTILPMSLLLYQLPVAYQQSGLLLCSYFYSPHIGRRNSITVFNYYSNIFF